MPARTTRACGFARFISFPSRWFMWTSRSTFGSLRWRIIIVDPATGRAANPPNHFCARERIPMPYLLNALYLFALACLSPWLLYRSLRTRKYRSGFLAKFLGQSLHRDGPSPCAWFHGVSVGEIHLLRTLVA